AAAGVRSVRLLLADAGLGPDAYAGRLVGRFGIRLVVPEGGWRLTGAVVSSSPPLLTVAAGWRTGPTRGRPSIRRRQETPRDRFGNPPPDPAPSGRDTLLRLAGHGPDDLVARARGWLAEERYADLARAVAFAVAAQPVPLHPAGAALLGGLLAGYGHDPATL